MLDILRKNSKMISHIGENDFYIFLNDYLNSIPNVIDSKIFLFENEKKPLILSDNKLTDLDSVYCQSIYLIDPAYKIIKKTSSETFATIIPSSYTGKTQQRYYDTFYKYINWAIESIFVIRLDKNKAICLSCYLNTTPIEISSYVSIVKEAILKHEEFKIYRNQRPAQELNKLTKREVDVYHHLLDGKTPGEISNRLKITEGTVRNHKKSIYKKLNIHNLNQLYSIYK